jgi:hypothetical protein
MREAKGAEIEAGADEMVEERRVEMTEGDFGTSDLVSGDSAFSGMKVSCAVMYMFSGSRSNSAGRSAE